MGKNLLIYGETDEGTLRQAENCKSNIFALNAVSLNAVHLTNLIMKDLFYKLKYAWQRASRGYDDLAIWNLNDAVKEIAVPILDRMIEDKVCYPAQLNNIDEWIKILKKMKAGFEAYNYIHNSMDYDKQTYEQKLIEQDEGLALFAKWFGSLWI